MAKNISSFVKSLDKEIAAAEAKLSSQKELESKLAKMKEAREKATELSKILGSDAVVEEAEEEEVEGEEKKPGRKSSKAKIVEELSEGRRSVFDAMNKKGEPTPVKEIIEATELSSASVSQYLSFLMEAGLVKRVSRGIYERKV